MKQDWRMPRLLALIIALFAVPAFAANPSYEEIVAQFEAISFSSERGGEHRRGVFARWPSNQTVRWKAYGHMSLEGREALDELSRLTGLKIIEANNTIRPTLEIYLDRSRGTGCHINMSKSPGQIVIRPRGRLSITRCFYEEFSQALGPEDDACEYRPSIWCDRDSASQLTFSAADRIILRATFDKRLPDFGPKELVMPRARRVLRELYEAEIGNE